MDERTEMRTIHKLVLPVQDEVEVEWPEGSGPLHVGVQNGVLDDLEER